MEPEYYNPSRTGKLMLKFPYGPHLEGGIIYLIGGFKLFMVKAP